MGRDVDVELDNIRVLLGQKYLKVLFHIVCLRSKSGNNLTQGFIISGKGLLVAGGQSGSRLDLVELFNLETRNSCVINGKLDQPRQYHTGDGNLVCGGFNNDYISSCYNVATGATINLLNGRSLHTSWSTDVGIYLLGGSPPSNLRTTELITRDTTQAGFGLQYDTR